MQVLHLNFCALQAATKPKKLKCEPCILTFVLGLDSVWTRIEFSWAADSIQVGPNSDSGQARLSSDWARTRIGLGRLRNRNRMGSYMGSAWDQLDSRSSNRSLPIAVSTSLTGTALTVILLTNISLTSTSLTSLTHRSRANRHRSRATRSRAPASLTTPSLT